MGSRKTSPTMEKIDRCPSLGNWFGPSEASLASPETHSTL